MNVIMAQFERLEPKIFSAILGLECSKQKIDLVVLGEFVANRFFKEYHSKATLKHEFGELCEYFGTLAKQLKITIIVPIIECEFVESSKARESHTFGSILKRDKFYKSIAIFDEKKVRFHRATRLMNFPHWDEASFFDNELRSNARPKQPLIFSVGGFKVSAIFGWEAHFDEIMINLRKKGVDILCVPCANTFGSNARWQRLMQTRSFLNSCFVVRVNRVGGFMENGNIWDFYGESFIALPDGNLGDMLGKKEGILVSEICKKTLDEIKDSWKLR